MSTAWPSSDLPAPRYETYFEEPVDDSIHSEVDGGYRVSRARHSRILYDYGFDLVLKTTQLTTLKSFWSDRSQSVLPFSGAPLPTSSTKTVTFAPKGLGQPRDFGADLWLVSVRLKDV